MTVQDEIVQEVQSRNKAKAREEQNAMREDLREYITNCSVHDLQKINDLIKVLEK
jgi:hypothetical protein